ncbi:MAG: hypothetical protein HEQ21_10125 [Blastomonas sp.]|uniref:hypothetical protein n=1 Tax=Blastomonas sp. TaxID=1909299 RepID=UPI00258ACD88|nr:hypothetical protein [Blastomonas sp.]MCO5793167.1 hypothetical protein [Blastomonas sp.]
MNSILALVMLSLGQAPATLAEVLSLPPKPAGERALASEAHGEIVEVEVLPPRGMNPPGVVEVDMWESTNTLYAGCQRQSWMVTFRHGRGQPRDSAQPFSKYAQQHVALKDGGNCVGVRFAEIGGTLSADQALSTLIVLQEAVKTGRRLKSVCQDKTKSGLCRSDARLKQELERLSPWVVTNQDGANEVWLGLPGQPITVVTTDAENRAITKVSRYVPAPF